jgi:hypothetical protein
MNTLPFIPAPAAILALALASPLAGVLGGCASAQMAVAEASVQQANSNSTRENAPAELQIAIDKLASARQAMTRKDYELAGQLAEQAHVDAQVAEMHAQSARSRKAAQESQEAARALSEEANRKTVR